MTYTRPIVYLIHIIGYMNFKLVYFFVSSLPFLFLVWEKANVE